MGTNPKLSFVCPLKWDEMRGDARERFCEKCQRSVINLSRMTKAQRAALLEKAKTERVCVAYLERVRAARPAAPAGPRTRIVVATVLTVGCAAALVAAVIADARRTWGGEPMPFDSRERFAYYYEHARSRLEEWTDNVRVFFGGTPRSPMIMTLGMVCTPAGPTVVPAPTTTAPATTGPAETPATEPPPSAPTRAH